jgi:hypothetical protein
MESLNGPGRAGSATLLYCLIRHPHKPGGSGRMASSGMLRRVVLVRTEVSKELRASFIRVTRIDELGTTLAVTSIVPSSPILVTLMKESLCSSETSVLTTATRRKIPEDAILHSHRRGNLKSYWMVRSSHLYPTRTGWWSYILGHWVPFSSPHTTGRATRLHTGCKCDNQMNT